MNQDKVLNQQDIMAFHAPTPQFLTLKTLPTKQSHNKAASNKHHATVMIAFPKHSKQPKEVWVRSEPDNEERLSKLSQIKQPAHMQQGWSYWQGDLIFNDAEDITLYCFKIRFDNVTVWLSALGLHQLFPERNIHFHLNPTYQPANWVWSQTFYQIFPERFYDGDPGNNPTAGEYLYEEKEILIKSWDDLPHQDTGPREFFGGDLQGITQKLDYIQDLGITGLYLNPIFTSHSSHKYDTVDYYSVDPHFGGYEAYLELRTETQKRNIRLMLDAVVNHTSDRNAWMDRYNEHPEDGAYQSKESKTYEFYTFEDEDDPESYSGWLGFIKTLPVLDFASEKVQDAIYKNSSQDNPSVIRHWLRPPYSIDAWRFDVIHMLGEGTGARNNAHYVREFRKAVREENSEAYVLGEHFFEATKWLQGDQEDGAMNYYGFARPVWNFLAKEDFRGDGIEVDAEAFDWLLGRARAQLPFPIQLSQFNLLGSHDTPRMLTRLDGDLALMKCAVTLLMTYIGVPCIYYGDEIGLTGGGDPHCRAPMPWEESKWNTDLQQHYKTLVSFRQENIVLQKGAFQSLYAQDDVYVFARLLNKTIVIVAINRGAPINLDIPIWKLGLEQGTIESILDNSSIEFSNNQLTIKLADKSSFIGIIESL